MKTLSKVKTAKLERNRRIINEFKSMSGTITAKVTAIADRYVIAEVTVRHILLRAGIIGLNKTIKTKKA